MVTIKKSTDIISMAKMQFQTSMNTNRHFTKSFVLLLHPIMSAHFEILFRPKKCPFLSKVSKYTFATHHDSCSLMHTYIDNVSTFLVFVKNSKWILIQGQREGYRVLLQSAYLLQNRCEEYSTPSPKACMLRNYNFLAIFQSHPLNFNVTL